MSKDKKMSEIIKALILAANPGRNINVEKLGGRFIVTTNDSVGCNDYILKGKYTYDKVVELNTLTGGHAGFGYCEEIGPVAFIGVINSRHVQNSGYFKHKVQGYGDSINEDEYYFEQYTEEEAKKINNYTVYGAFDPRVLKGAAPIEKLKYFYDYRYKQKNEKSENFNSDVLEMDIRLGGLYDFYEAREFAYGSRGEFTGASGEDVPIQFAIVDEKYPVGIMDLWKHYANAEFKDVWGLGEKEPKTQSLRFLSDEEASKINCFKLYFFVPTHSFGTKKYVIEKKDRMLNKEFNFIMEDGSDYRLQEEPREKEKVKTLK